MLFLFWAHIFFFNACSMEIPVGPLVALPSDLVHEIESHLYGSDSYFPQAIQDRDNLYATCKTWQAAKPECPAGYTIKTLARKFGTHPLLVGALLQKKSEWLDDIQKKIQKSGEITILTDDEAEKELCNTKNEIEGKLAILTREFRRSVALAKTPKAHALYTHLFKKYAQSCCYNRAVLSDDDKVLYYPSQKNNLNDLILKVGPDAVEFCDLGNRRADDSILYGLCLHENYQPRSTIGRPVDEDRILLDILTVDEITYCLWRLKDMTFTAIDCVDNMHDYFAVRHPRKDKKINTSAAYMAYDTENKKIAVFDNNDNKIDEISHRALK